MSNGQPGARPRSALPAQIRRARRRQAGASETPRLSRPRRRAHSGAMPDPAVLVRAIATLFAGQGWQPQPFRRALWQAAADGHGGLLHADTGAGKTWAAWGAALLRGAERLICLGDLSHAASGLGPALDERLSAWQAMHHELAIELVHGNHHRHACVPAGLEVRLLGEAHAEPPFLLCHEPPIETNSDAHVLAGHLHPGIVLRAAGDRLRLPCFAFADRIGLLPAFGAFTGLGALPRDRRWRAFPVAAGRVFEVSDLRG